ncbi:hypothetical protein [Helicobacter sp. MIT 01-3238]|nr:hypothetical protein [Helicobacter sp. MIT 01-3238]
MKPLRKYLNLVAMVLADAKSTKTQTPLHKAQNQANIFLLPRLLFP